MKLPTTVAMAQVLPCRFLLAAVFFLALLAQVPRARGAVAVVPDMTGSKPGCPDMCGDVHIPYPFGIGDGGCALLEDFVITCNHSFTPPRPYTGINIEVKSISLEAGEMAVASLVSRTCYSHSSNTIESDRTYWQVHPFLISPTRNVFTGIGCDTLALLDGRGDGSFLTGCVTYCASLHQAAENGDDCTGLGCCQIDVLPSNLSTINVYFPNTSDPGSAWGYSPCSYAFVSEKGWYHFDRRHLTRLANKTFTDRVPERSIPLVLDWSILTNDSCEANGSAPACVSTHSYCVNAPQGSGYLCNCSQGYTGNPYLPGGCKDIKECDLRKEDPEKYEQMYPCLSRGSTCQDIEGGYKCKCRLGLKGDGKTRNGCQLVVPLYVIFLLAITLAVAVASLVIGLLVRRMQRKIFVKNGGKILERSRGITVFTAQDLKKMTKGYRKLLGKGQFGEVYSGATIDGAEPVAVKVVKRTRSGWAGWPVTKRIGHWLLAFRRAFRRHEEPRDDDDPFVKEITFQFRMSHPNVVRLVGCCLETDVPGLVFELVPKGSLEDMLHGSRRDHPLSLLQRLDIAIGSAEAVSHMHSHGDHVHGDIKPANILLGDDLTPKVSDFGSATLLSSDRDATCVHTDQRYLDPVYRITDLYTEKSDVYSFGLVLLELITRKATDGDQRLRKDFVKCCKIHGNGRLMYDQEMVDAQPLRHVECLDRIGALAVRCLKLEDVDERPSMAEVAEELKRIKKLLLA